jgi:hypothetical protein
MAHTKDQMITEDKDHIRLVVSEVGIRMEVSSYNFKVSVILSPEEIETLRKILSFSVKTYNKLERNT